MNTGGTHSIRRRARRVVLASVVALAAGSALSAAPANAEANTPRCGQILASGKSWLSGGGVSVVGNGSSTGTNENCIGKYSFVSHELVERLWINRGWVPKEVGFYGLPESTLFTNAQAKKYGMRAVPNGQVKSTRFKPGDAVVWSGSRPHVALIKTVTGTGSNLTLGIVEQNYPTPGRKTGVWGTDTLTVRNGSFAGNRASGISGIVHPRGNRFDATKAVSFRNVGDGYAIDIRGRRATLGAIVTREDPSNAKSQRFYLVPAAQGRYLVASALNKNRVLQTVGEAGQAHHGGFLQLGAPGSPVPRSQEFAVQRAYRTPNAWVLSLPPKPAQEVQPYCIRSTWRIEGPGWQLDTGGCPGDYADWIMQP